MKRLLMITDRFAPDIGGVARSASRTASRFAALGIETDVFAWTKLLPPGQVETTEVQENVTLHRMGLFSNWDLSLQHSMNLLEWLHTQHPFDMTWGHYLYPAGFMAVMIAKQFRIKSTVSARGNDVDRMMFPPGDFARLRWTLEQADTITAVSQDLARKIDVILGNDDSCRVVHNTVDCDLFHYEPADAELRQSLGIAENEWVLGFSGELRHKKGLHFMLDALATVRARLADRPVTSDAPSRSACLLVVGEVRQRDRALLTDFALERPDASDRILITGRIDDPADVRRHLNLCDLFLQPSVWDGLPNAVLEAMACEKVVVGSDAGGIPEVIESDQSGFMLPRVQLHRLADAIIDVISLSEDDRRQIGQRARLRVQKDFCEDRELATLRQLLSELGFE